MKIAQRIQNIPPYLFTEIDRKKNEAIKRGVDIINLSIGDPDKPTPNNIVEKIRESVKDPKNHRYPPYSGTPEFRKAVAQWYKDRCQVELDPDQEVITLIGSKEGIAHIFLAFIDPGDFSLLPDPAYPAYKTGTLFANGIPYIMPLLEENNFLPDLEEIEEEVAQKAKVMFINYPNNPTAGVASKEFFEKVVSFAQKYDILVCHDFAYSEITFDNYRAPSFLEVEGAKEVGIEFHSLSKLYNMTGWRIGFAVGNKKVINALSIIKSNIDTGVFRAIQAAGVEALTGPQDNIAKMNKLYSNRRNVLINGLNKLGWNLKPTQGTFYIWVPTIRGMSSVDFANLLLDKCGIIVVPGIGYGEYGEGYIRIALTVEEERLEEAIERLKQAGIHQ